MKGQSSDIWGLCYSWIIGCRWLEKASFWLRILKMDNKEKWKIEEGLRGENI